MTRREAELKMFELLEEAARIAKEVCPDITTFYAFQYQDGMHLSCYAEHDDSDASITAARRLDVSHYFRDGTYFYPYGGYDGDLTHEQHTSAET